MSSPSISVVIPTYNSARTVGAAISSALTQTYPDVEVIVVNDGSTDEGPAIARAHGDGVRVIDQENQGVAAARNTAIKQANGDLIALLDADDILLPRYLERAVAAWQGAGGGKRFVACEAYILGLEGLFPRRRVLPLGAVRPARQRIAMIERNAGSIFCVFPRQMIDEIGGFEESLRYCEDYDLWLRAVLEGWEIVFQTEPQALYRRTSVTASRAEEKMQEALRRIRTGALEKYRTSLGQEEIQLFELIDRLGPAGDHVLAGEAALRDGRGADAAAEFETATRVAPLDRRLRLKAALLRIPPTRGVLATLQSRRRVEAGDEIGTPVDG